MWIYKKEEIKDWVPNGYRGFIYIIKNLDNNKWYIGKKDYWSFRKNKGWVESNWRTYQSSSIEVKSWTNVKKVILCHCYTDTELNYREIEYQIKYEALLRNDCVNWCIGDGIKIGRIPDYMIKG